MRVKKYINVLLNAISYSVLIVINCALQYIRELETTYDSRYCVKVTSVYRYNIINDV